MNHAKGEWVGRNGQTTNAVEGAWGRLKKLVRAQGGLRNLGVAQLAVGEFLWRERFLSGPDKDRRALAALLPLIKA